MHARLAMLVLASSLAFATLLACGSRPGPGAPVGLQGSPSASATDATAASPAEAHGKPLEFTLDPLDRDAERGPESLALRGKRAVVIVVTTYDFGSQKLLRVLAPTLRALPADAACLIVARQPLGDRVLVQTFLDSEPLPCRRAIGDPARGKLGDLEQVKVVPAVLVLHADGSLADAGAGDVKPEQLERALERAKR
jgi:hypothetical protein